MKNFRPHLGGGTFYSTFDSGEVPPLPSPSSPPFSLVPKSKEEEKKVSQAIQSAIDTSFFVRERIERIEEPLKALKNLPYRNESIGDLRNETVKISDHPFTVVDDFITDDPPCDFKKIIERNQGTITYMGSGQFGHAFRFCHPADCDKVYVIKLIMYDRTDHVVGPLPINDITRPENVEVLMAKFLAPFVENFNTPHISMPVFAFRCEYGDDSIKGLREKISIKNSRSADDFKAQYEANAHDARGVTPIDREPVLVYFGEWANFGDFGNYLRKLDFSAGRMADDSNKILKIMLFQLIYTYAIILDKYPSFRHNDLSVLNLLVQEINTQVLAARSPPITSPYSYKFNDNNFVIPLQKASVRLWDFDFANSNEMHNTKVHDPFYKGSGIQPATCPQYDIHYFLNYIIDKNHKYGAFSPEIKTFIETWVPLGLPFGFPQKHPKGLRGFSDNINLRDGRLSTQFQKDLSVVNTTIKMRDGTEQTIPYSQLTPQYSLENDFFWNEFRKTPEEVEVMREFSGTFSN